MSALVYQAINAVAADLAASGIAKKQHNEEADYAYRGIDDVLNALAPLLAKHRLCVLPRVLEREALRGRGEQRVVLRVAFDLVSAIDGSIHVIESFGEAIDDSDKGTAKAMSAAYKAAMLQAFCVPVPHEDADASSPRLNGHGDNTITLAEPPEGWDGWSAEVIDIATSCESAEAIDRLLARRRDQLSALQRGNPALYATVGEAIAVRLAELQRPAGSVRAAQQAKSPKRNAPGSSNEAKKQEQQYAAGSTAQAA
jgi:hypothetical protein